MESIRRRRFYSFLCELFLIAPLLINQLWHVTKITGIRQLADIWFSLETIVHGVLLFAAPSVLYELADRYLYFSKQISPPMEWNLASRVKMILVSLMLLVLGGSIAYSYLVTFILPP